MGVFPTAQAMTAAGLPASRTDSGSLSGITDHSGFFPDGHSRILTNCHIATAVRMRIQSLGSLFGAEVTEVDWSAELDNPTFEQIESLN